MLTGNNGILNRSSEAKNLTGVGQETEIIALSYNSAIIEKNSKGDTSAVTGVELDLAIKTYDADASASDGDGEIIVTFKNGHIYSIDDNGTIDEYKMNSNDGKLASEVFEASGTTVGKMHVGDYVNYPVYYDNVASFVSKFNNNERMGFPKDEYTGWRVLSIEGSEGNEYIKLISAGIPINYNHGLNSLKSIEDLTTNFFGIPINPSYVWETFCDCGFKTGQNGTTITNISDLMNIFNNSFTAKFKSGESAVYIDEWGSNRTFINSNAEGMPKVQSLTPNDLDKVLGWNSFSWGNDLKRSDNLLVIPAKDYIFAEGEYACTWLLIPFGDGMQFSNLSGEIDDDDEVEDGVYGIRCTVCLESQVRYTIAEGSSEVDEVKTWDIY